MLRNPFASLRGNQTWQWSPMDTEENYKPFQADGRPNYAVDAFNYKFNSDGFRCDEFSEHSDLPILFAGCSYTEGIGLPLDEVWSTHLLNNIRLLPQHVDKKIPFWSLALAGTGTDTAARELEIQCKKIKPKYIFYLMFSLNRREFMFNDTGLQNWMPHQGNPKWIDIYETVGRSFIDQSFALYQSYRSLCIINAIAEQYNTKVFMFFIKNLIDDFEKFKNMTRSLINVEMVFVDVDDDEFRNIPLSVEETCMFDNKPELARDNSHYGSKWQYQIYKRVLTHLQNTNDINLK